MEINNKVNWVLSFSEDKGLFLLTLEMAPEKSRGEFNFVCIPNHVAEPDMLENTSEI